MTEGRVTPTVSQTGKEHTAAQWHLLWLPLHTLIFTCTHVSLYTEIYDFTSALLQRKWWELTFSDQPEWGEGEGGTEREVEGRHERLVGWPPLLGSCSFVDRREIVIV